MQILFVKNVRFFFTIRKALEVSKSFFFNIQDRVYQKPLKMTVFSDISKFTKNAIEKNTHQSNFVLLLHVTDV